MQYTTGNWTVKSLTTDTISTTKNIAVTDLDYANDFAPSVSAVSEATLKNTTGSSFASPEEVRYGKSTVANVYAGTDVPTLNMFANKTGVRTLAEVKFNLQATNSVSGQEVLLPCRGWTCLVVPDASLITDDAVEYLLKRTIAVAFNTGATDESREAEIARGALLPG